MTSGSLSDARRAISVRGIVQGVGFRPFVHDLAQRHSLRGFVKNVLGEVRIEVEGHENAIDSFVEDLTRRAPPLARIDRLESDRRAPVGDADFRILPSDRASAHAPTLVAPDTATCDDCVREILDPRDRRHDHPFANCTQCGPRLTVTFAAPYDRERTTMRAFEMCEACAREYGAPSDRRFHAQPIACPQCGPRLSLVDARGTTIASEDPLTDAARLLSNGRIGAIKGIGGYHLACIATDSNVVGELRRRKVRDDKPFAILVATLEDARRLCEISRAEAALLESRARPIVLVAKKENCEIAPEVAPESSELGLMLPYSPLHHLLARRLGGAPIVLTSANVSDEPIAKDDEDALARLGNVADFFLMHDRPIFARCDDSVARVVEEKPVLLRRSRGYAPAPLSMPVRAARPTLALGAQLKSTFAFGAEELAFVSPHLGDQHHLEAQRSFELAISQYESLFGLRPALLVHDLHPDYASTIYARARGARESIPTVAVQHHHAHVASCMAEHGLPPDSRVIGVTFDGAGLGLDGTIWGGEIFVGGYGGFERKAHLRCVAMPGGDVAMREPWRMALAHALAAGADLDHVDALRARDAQILRVAKNMIDHGVNAPRTSSVGRLFDAVAAILGEGERVTFEGQAAMRLERLASRSVENSARFAIDMRHDDELVVLDPAVMIREIIGRARRGDSREDLAFAFHLALAEAVHDACHGLRSASGVDTVVLSGGVFMNSILTRATSRALRGSGFRVLRHEAVPTNDGGLSIGQLAIASARKEAS